MIRETADGRVRGAIVDVASDEAGFLLEHAAAFGLDDPDARMVRLAERPMPFGATVSIYQRLHRGVPVHGAELRLVYRASRVRYVTAQLPPPLELEVTPTLSEPEARAAIARYHADARPVADGTLVVLDTGLWDGGDGGHPVLAWRFDLEGSDDAAFVQLFVSASDGTPLVAAPLLRTYRARVHDGGDVPHWGQLAPGAQPLWFAEPAMSTDDPGPLRDSRGYADAMEAFLQSRLVHGYFLERFGHQGLDGMDRFQDIFVRHGDSSTGFAAWIPTAEPLLVFAEGMHSTDVHVHELTHGIVHFINPTPPTGILESGATGEAIADAFAAFVDRLSPWTMGDGTVPGPVRDLSVPRANACGPGPSPARYADRVLATDLGACRVNAPGDCNAASQQACVGGRCYAVSDADDRGGIHCNSLIPGHAVFLMTDGGPGDGRTIRGIGAGKSELLAFATLPLLGASPTFEDQYYHLLAACILAVRGGLEGGGAPFVPPDCAAVINAFHAVGVAPFPDGDEDGWDDRWDNCRDDFNFDQEDADGDGVGDACGAPSGVCPRWPGPPCPVELGGLPLLGDDSQPCDGRYTSCLSVCNDPSPRCGCVHRRECRYSYEDASGAWSASFSWRWISEDVTPSGSVAWVDCGRAEPDVRCSAERTVCFHSASSRSWDQRDELLRLAEPFGMPCP